ncbi:hypothetical protein ALON55S_07568 [Alishewanella longhuensis]
MIRLPKIVTNVFGNMWLALTNDDIKPAMRSYMRGQAPIVLMCCRQSIH